MSRLELFGGFALREGRSVWQHGAFTRAVQTPGTIVLLDEFDRCRPDNAVVLNKALQDRELFIPDTGEHVRFAPGVRVVACANTNGTGDFEGRYGSAREQDKSTLSRFAVGLNVDFLPAHAETKILASRAGIHKNAAAYITHFANKARDTARAGGSAPNFLPSLRHTVRFAHALRHDIEPRHALESTLIWDLADEEKNVARALFKEVFDEDRAAKALAGQEIEFDGKSETETETEDVDLF
jgi:midasin (ATPase involved in ribosome maturation)